MWQSLNEVLQAAQHEHRSGQPNELTTTEMVKKIHKMVLDDCRIKVRKFADMVGISKSAVNCIFTLLGRVLLELPLCSLFHKKSYAFSQKVSKIFIPFFYVMTVGSKGYDATTHSFEVSDITQH